jgi:diguanylate cyclase (GGDEF)-like protein
MAQLSSNSIEDRLHLLRTRWERYVADGRFEQFIEFAVAVNSLTEHFSRLRLPGLLRLCEGLENAALTRLTDMSVHPLAPQEISSLQRQIDTLLGSVATSRPPAGGRRAQVSAVTEAASDWIKPRSVWMVATPGEREIASALCRQLQFFGFRVFELAWCDRQLPDDKPLAILFAPAHGDPTAQELACIRQIRASCPASQLIHLGSQADIEPIVRLMRAGIDVTLPVQDEPAMVINCVLDLVQAGEQQQYRVLVVEDSRVAVALIQRALAEHGIDTRAVTDPAGLLQAVESYRPDLILMDMHMPCFSGIEATRALRQMAAYRTLPIVYLSGESDIGMQIEALRLGGDQFLIKPFNPVLLTAVVKARIERFRETRRSSRLDGLTGLFNHTAAKARLQAMLGPAPLHDRLTVAMIDIDHFKAINDTYGHLVGDQVIQALAWLLKGRLRARDLIGRYGGEEFLIALPDVGPEQAHAVIDRIRGDFSGLPHAHPDGAVYATFSAGIASYPLIGTATELIEAADRALLEAKRLGRNRLENSVVQDD